MYAAGATPDGDAEADAEAEADVLGDPPALLPLLLPLQPAVAATTRANAARAVGTLVGIRGLYSGGMSRFRRSFAGDSLMALDNFVRGTRHNGPCWGQNPDYRGVR